MNRENGTQQDTPSPPLRLARTGGNAPHATWDLFPGLTIGRSTDNDVSLDDSLVSKHHCQFFQKDDAWMLKDLGSSNGTYVDGRLVRTAEVRDGSIIRLGTSELRVEPTLPDAPVEFEPVMTQILDLSLDSGTFLPELLLDETAIRKDYEKLRAAHEMNRQMAIDLPLDELLGKILDVVFDMIQADTGAILLGDGDGELTPRCVRTREGVACENIERPFSRTVLREAFNHRRGILATDALKDDRFSGSESVLFQGIRSVMCAPMIGSKRVYGVIHLDNRDQAGAFTEKDLQILSSAAYQAAMALENSNLLVTVEENTRTKEQLKRFLPPAIISEMMRDRIELDRAPRELTATVLFSDIRGFTSLSEKTTAPELIRMLNAYFDRMVEVVFEHGGVLDKFVGDALMAVWGTLDQEPDNGAGKAVATARDMLVSLHELNEAARDHRVPFHIGIGVNTGPLVAGFMGSHSRRLEFTVVGDTVNVASRLCSLAKANEIIIGDDTFRAIGAPSDAETLEGIPIKGKSEPLRVYRLPTLLP